MHPVDPRDDPPGDFAPTASLETLQRRAALLRFVRAYFERAGYWEVETAVLSRDVVVDAHLDPFTTEDDDGRLYYLQTSPEFAMKRLLAAGATAIFQIARVFRRGETGRLHNPEFTMLEWYRVGDTHREQMDFTEALVAAVLREFGDGANPAVRESAVDGAAFGRLTYDEAFQKMLGTPVLKLSCEELRKLATDRGVRPSAGFHTDDRDGWLNLLNAEFVEPQLGVERPTFLFDYPASQAALAIVRDGDPPVAERFELFVAGMEICNGYRELTDPDELRRRIREQSAVRRRDGLRELPSHSRLLEAMQAGLPACSGVALGLDRLAAATFGCTDLSSVMAFPIDRA